MQQARFVMADMFGTARRGVGNDDCAPSSVQSNEGVIRQLLGRMPSGSRIEISGGIGAGKSTIARVLTTAWDLPLIRESYEDIPFWESYYANPAEYELEKNVSFLLAHGDAIRTAMRAHPGYNLALFDFALFQDLAYADLSSSREDADVVERLYDRLVARFGRPALVIDVRCPVAEQLVRIGRRGREPEADIDASFLLQLSESITCRLGRFDRNVPVISIDSVELNFVERPAEAIAMLEQLIRDVLSPLSTAL